MMGNNRSYGVLVGNLAEIDGPHFRNSFLDKRMILKKDHKNEGGIV